MSPLVADSWKLESPGSLKVIDSKKHRASSESGSPYHGSPLLKTILSSEALGVRESP